MLSSFRHNVPLSHLVALPVATVAVGTDKYRWRQEAKLLAMPYPDDGTGELSLLALRDHRA